MANRKEIYREFSRYESSLPIFSRDWWLDITAGPEQWDVALVVKGDQVMAAMPYVLRRKYGMQLISQPALTQKLGPWLRPAPGKPATRLAHEKDLMQHLIDQLPPFDHFTQNWHYDCTNWLPFCWNGFRQTTRYTYVLPQLGDEASLWANLEDNVRKHCKKAVKRFGLHVRSDLPLETLLELNRMTFARQGLTVPYSDDYVRRIDAACAERGCRRYFIAVDDKGQAHAASYIIWDEHSAYGLMNGADPALRHSGATTLCFWESIRHACGVTQRYDFTGSMMEPVERFFRGFGAVQIPYFNITKTPSRLLTARQMLLSMRSTAPGGAAVSLQPVAVPAERPA